MSMQEKTHLYTAIKSLQRTAANIAERDKTIYKEQLDKSKILQELAKKQK